MDHVQDKADEQGKLIKINQQEILLRTDNEAIDVFKEYLKDNADDIDIRLERADEQITFLFLETFISLEITGSIGRSRTDVQYFHFHTCRFDERFFELLGTKGWFASRRRFFEWFADCQINLNDIKDVQKVSLALNALGQITLLVYGMYLGEGILNMISKPENYLIRIVTAYGSSELRRDISKHEDKSTIIETALVHQEWRYGKSFAPLSSTLVKKDEPALISDSALFFLAARLPNVVKMEVWGDCTRDFFDEFFNAFRKRSTVTALPCHLDHSSWLRKSQFALQTLDVLSQYKLTNLNLQMTYKDVSNMEAFLTRVLDVLSHSVYVTEVTVNLDNHNQSDLQNYLFLLRGIRKIAPRMRRFRFVARSRDGYYPNFSDDVPVLQSELEEIYENALDHDHVNCFWIVSSKTLRGSRFGSSYLLRLLPLDVLRELHRFLV